MELTQEQRKQEASGFVQQLAAMAPKESFGQFTRRIQDLFTEMELAESPEDQEMYAVVLQELLSVEMRDRVDAIAAVITRGDLWAAEAKRLSGIAARHQANADRLKDYTKEIMIGMGVKELKTPTSRLLVAGNGGVQPLEVAEDLSIVPDCLLNVIVRMSKNDYDIYLAGTGDIIAVEPNNAAIRAELAKPCEKCNGTGIPVGSAWEDGAEAPKCVPCMGTGKKLVPGAKLLPRGKHLRVEGSALMLDGAE